jgi:hypothetical protein
MLNIDDVHKPMISTSQSPDTNPSYEDMAFGGAGRDVMIANTGGDRTIDWVAEFNSYFTPFAPFGMPTSSDQLAPALPDYLYALSKSDGADQTLAAQHGGAAARNGEPFGELGLIIRQDAAWDDQRGAPRDPQAGNIPGGPRDVLRTSGTHVMNSPSGTVNLVPSSLLAPAGSVSTTPSIQLASGSGPAVQTLVTFSGAPYAYSSAKWAAAKAKKQAKRGVTRGPSRLRAL